MAPRGDEATLQRGERESAAADAVSSLYTPFQTLTALAFETGQAVRQTFGESDLTSGLVEEGSQFNKLPKNDDRPDHSTEPEAQLFTDVQVDQVDTEQRRAESSPVGVDPEAVRADIDRVQRKTLSTNAATEVILRFNFMGGRESKAALLCVALSILAGAAVLIVEFVHKMEQGNQEATIKHSATWVWNVAIGSICLLCVSVFLGSLLWRVLDAVRLHKHWKHRQKRNVTLIVLEASLQWLNLVFYVVPNILNLADPCYFLADDWFYLGFARWTCWNTIFALFLVHAYSTRLWKPQAADSSTLSPAAIEHGFQSPEGHSKLIMDGPWILLWPCLLIWPFFEGVVGFGFIHNGIDSASLEPVPVLEANGVLGTTYETAFQACKTYPAVFETSALHCGVDRATGIIVDFIVALALLYFVVTYLLLALKLKGYRKQPYASVQVGLVYNTLQLWLRMAVMSFFTLCLVLLWLVGPGWCTSEYFSWLGLMPMQIVMSANTVVLCYVASPRTPEEHVAASTVWLQEFAWTEADKPVKLAARSAMVPDNPKLAKQPIFCFETMMNLLYWSCYVYDHKMEQTNISTPKASRPTAEQQEKHGTQEKLEGTSFTASTTLNVETALSLYKLTHSQSFWETKQDTRCLVGWGNSTVVVAFRGTASMKNALADLQAWRIAHPPMRGTNWLGTRPLVHVGFLKSWLAGGLKHKVVSHILEAVRQCKQESRSDQPVKIFVTGHSLGGALATLAAFDIRRHLMDNMQSNAEVVCYTFAAPRTGNHAFAREYNAMMPDTWSVINDQDVVTREGKMLFLYKRPGQRVILNASGHMMVRPTHMEASVQKSVGGQSVRHHLLTNYMHAILSVVLAQFTGLGFLDGMEGVIKLAEASSYVQDILQTQMGMSLPEMKAFCQADPAAKTGQSLPGAHLPSKGFWLTKRPTAPSTAAAPSGRAGRLMHKLSFKTQSSASSLQRTSDGF
ncbi:MAG: hypothetical protein FRX49_00818 [Trebouxia sp. A1-2]|nr:MAG: hypothetical protein FRX49_00818 [Trebouxia sp. A1-2]